jgi:hypothetical protein
MNSEELCFLCLLATCRSYLLFETLRIFAFEQQPRLNPATTPRQNSQQNETGWYPNFTSEAHAVRMIGPKQ